MKQVVIEASRGNGYTGDIAVDDVMILPGRCPTGSLSYLILKASSF